MVTQYSDALTALSGVVSNGAVIAVGAFGLSGVPFDLVEALRDTGVRDLTIVPNNMGVDGQGLGLLIENQQVAKVIASYVGENRLFAQQYLDRRLEVEFVLQRTLAERLRAEVERAGSEFTSDTDTEGKPQAEFDGRTYLLAHCLVADVCLVHARHADPVGNLKNHATARNFNPLIAAASRVTLVTLVEAERLPETSFDPDQVITSGIYVDRLVTCRPRLKPIEHRTMHRSVVPKSATREELPALS